MDESNGMLLNKFEVLPPDIVAIRRLLAAVLYRAAMDYANARATKDRMSELSLESWFRNDELLYGDGNGLSFAWICECLDLDPRQFRIKLFDKWRIVAWTDTAKHERKFPDQEDKVEADGNVIRKKISLPKGVQRTARRDQAALAA